MTRAIASPNRHQLNADCIPVVGRREGNLAVELCPARSDVDGLMLGRGLLRDPFLPAAIKGLDLPTSRRDVLHHFHNDLVEAYAQAGMSPGHILDKMRPLWSYLAHSFEEPDKLAKKFKKARRMARYQSLIESLFG